ncbi:12215_t:CDS:1, partial [Dentiscutata heterogama]
AKSSAFYTLVKSNKTTYVELLELSKKLIDYAIKINLKQDLLNTFKILIHNAQNGNQEKKIYLSNTFNQEEKNYLSNIFNSAIIKHKSHPPKRLKASIKNNIYKDK